MKILFVQPSADFFIRGTTYPVCRSIMTTATYMKSVGHEVMVFDRCIDFRKKEKVFDEFMPQLVMVYVTPAVSIKDSIEISAFAKDRGCFTVWGEIIAASLAEEAVERGCTDFVINGETERKLQLLVEELTGNSRFENVPGLTYLKNGRAVSNANENCSDLSTLPGIDWELIDVEKCFRKFPFCQKMLYLYTSRGCPYKCTYCYNTTFYNSEHRKRPLHFVLEEIKHLEKKHGLDGANFSDELLLLSDDEIKEIAEFRKVNGLKFLWGGETRADIYKNPETLAKMYDAGCRWLLLGLETGSKKTQELINKPLDFAAVREFVDNCTKAGIATFGSFIIGLPDETEEQIKETVQYAQSLDLDAFLFSYYNAIPKTPLCNMLVESGRTDTSKLLDKSTLAGQLQDLTKNYSQIPDKDLCVIKSWFDWLTFTRKKKQAAEKNAFMKKALDTLKHFSQGNIKRSAENLMSSAKTFVTVVFYAHCFPSVKKKYGLKNINKRH